MAAAVLLGLAGLRRSGGARRPDAGRLHGVRAPTARPSGLVLRVEYTGGFVSPSVTAGRLPLVSVYADGRVHLRGAGRRDLSGSGPAQPAGAADRPAAAVQDARRPGDGRRRRGDHRPGHSRRWPTRRRHRFTLVTADGTPTCARSTRCRRRPGAAAGSPEQQQAARAEAERLPRRPSRTSAQAGTPRRTRPTAIAAVVTPWVDPQDGLPQPEVAWPGPALPGEPTGGLPDVSCVTATGDQAQALLAAAASANAATPWVTPDGTRWSVVFRPLLPDESGCADLTD